MIGGTDCSVQRDLQSRALEEVMSLRFMTAAMLACVMTSAAFAQTPKPLSPSGSAAAQVGGKYVRPAGRGAPALGGEAYEGGKWIEITYGRPLKRGRITPRG